MIFQRKPAVGGRWYFEVYSDSGKLLATSMFLTASGHQIAASSCITRGTPTVTVNSDSGDPGAQWYFEIFAGPGDAVIPEARGYSRAGGTRRGARPRPVLTHSMKEAKRTGPGEPVII